MFFFLRVSCRSVVEEFWHLVKKIELVAVGIWGCYLAQLAHYLLFGTHDSENKHMCSRKVDSKYVVMIFGVFYIRGML